MSGELVIGLGCRPGVSEHDVRAAVRALLDRHGLDQAAIRAYATLDTRADEPGLRAVAARRLLGFPAESLAGLAVPNPSRQVAAATGTPSVAEAAALRGAALLGPPGAQVELVAEKLTGNGVTAAAARVPRPPRAGPPRTEGARRHVDPTAPDRSGCGVRTETGTGDG